MSDCNNDCENCKIEEFCGYSVDTLGYAEFSRLVEEHDKQIRTETIDEFVQWAYIHGVGFSFMGKIKEDGTSDVVDRLNAIKSNFYKEMKEQKNE